MGVARKPTGRLVSCDVSRCSDGFLLFWFAGRVRLHFLSHWKRELWCRWAPTQRTRLPPKKHSSLRAGAHTGVAIRFLPPVGWSVLEGTRYAFNPRATRGLNICSHQFLNWWQELSAGQFHVNGFESLSKHKKKSRYP